MPEQATIFSQRRQLPAQPIEEEQGEQGWTPATGDPPTAAELRWGRARLEAFPILERPLNLATAVYTQLLCACGGRMSGRQEICEMCGEPCDYPVTVKVEPMSAIAYALRHLG